jgi:hypothetical protein
MQPIVGYRFERCIYEFVDYSDIDLPNSVARISKLADSYCGNCDSLYRILSIVSRAGAFDFNLGSTPSIGRTNFRPADLPAFLIYVCISGQDWGR